MPTISVIIPVLNEEGAIGAVVSAVPPGLAREVLVVDGGSSDRTVAVAEAAGARVLVERWRGYGRACLTGAEAATSEILVFLDGDFSDDPAEMPAVLAPLIAGEADLVIGSRLAGERERGAMPLHALLGNWASVRLVRLLYGVPIGDLGSFRAIRRQLLIELGMRELTYGWPTEMIVRTARRGFRVRQVPVRHRRRIGTSKVSGTVKGSALAAYKILSTTLRYRFADM
jgi:glycosyltransferase involved in cell wall biosynthesis